LRCRDGDGPWRCLRVNERLGFPVFGKDSIWRGGAGLTVYDEMGERVSLGRSKVEVLGQCCLSFGGLGVVCKLLVVSLNLEKMGKAKRGKRNQDSFNICISRVGGSVSND
jgi:hypothetical protein